MTFLRLTNTSIGRVRVETRDGRAYFLGPENSVELEESSVLSIFPEEDVLREVIQRLEPVQQPVQPIEAQKSDGMKRKKNKD